MERIISLPSSRELRAKILEQGMTYKEWSAHNHFKKELAYQVLYRYAGKIIKESRIHGRKTWSVIEALEAL